MRLMDLKGLSSLSLAALVVIVVIVVGAAVYYGPITGFITLDPGQQGDEALGGGGAGDERAEDISEPRPGATSAPVTGETGLIVGRPVITDVTQPTQPAQPDQNETSGDGDGDNETTGGQVTGTGSGSGSGSGGGGGSPPCTPSWSCSAWSDCSPSGTQTRICTDVNQCGTNEGRPAVSQGCTYIPPEPAENNESCSGVCVMPAVLAVDRTENESFAVYVYINTTEDVYATEFKVMFNQSIINATSVVEGDFLKSDGASTYPIIQTDNDEGEVLVANTRFATTTPVTGEGILADIMFSVIGPESSGLGLDSVKIVDTDLHPIDIPVFNATVSITE